jgi:hypothetical protein
VAKILDPTTPEELLWRDAVELVAELTKSTTTAEALLIAFSPKTIRNRHGVLEGKLSLNRFLSPPKPSRDPMPDEMGFWHPTPNTNEKLDINREQSLMRWSRGISKYATNFKVYPVWVHRDDIIKVLRIVGLLPLLAAPLDDTGKRKSDALEPLRGEVDKWVFNRMKKDGSKIFDRSYISDLYELQLELGVLNVSKGRIRNLVGHYRSTEFQALRPPPRTKSAR